MHAYTPPRIDIDVAISKTLLSLCFKSWLVRYTVFLFLYFPAFSISLAVSNTDTAKQALLAIKTNVASLAAAEVLDLAAVAHDDEQADDGADEHNET
jgi:hypothetical protein